MIKIDFNIELDCQVYAEFHNFRVSGTDFGLRIKKDHPRINLVNYEKYITEFYKEKRAEIEISTSELSGTISQKSDLYFAAIKKYFGLDYGKENYNGYIPYLTAIQDLSKTDHFKYFIKKATLISLKYVF